jgi:hypothetical protein
VPESSSDDDEADDDEDDSSADDDSSSCELAMCCAGRVVLVKVRRRTVFVCCGCGVDSAKVKFSESSFGRRVADCASPGDTRPACWNWCWARARSDGFCDDLRAKSEFPRVRRVTGGPREVSWPALKEAGGRLVAGERGSVPEVAGWGAKYEGEGKAADAVE